ncbi:MAG: insulinase family protein [Candidatus Izemoplasmatales bacterium]|nr:insulinase family protein [Candidatus Izemoplasmatales bacterium]
MKIVKRNVNNLELYYMPNNKFKTIDVAFVFTNKLNPQEINERNFLSEILMESTHKYNNPEKMSLACDNLYGLDKTCNYHTVGNVSITSFMFRTVNDKYLDELNIFSQSLDLLLEIIYRPKLHKGLIPKKSVNELIQQTEELMLSIKQNKNAYTYYQFMREYTRNNQDHIVIFPEMRYFNQVSSITVSECYKKMINEDKLQIFIAGDFDFSQMDNLIEEKLSFIKPKNIHNLDYKSQFIPTENINEVIEKSSNGQTRVFIGYYLNFDYNKKNALKMSLFDELFGGFEKAKLFANIREKLQLSYYVYSKYNEESNLFFVNLETNKDQTQKAIDEIAKQLKDCQKGNIDNELFNLAKRNLIKRLDSALDSQTKLLLHNIIGYLRYKSVFDLELRKQEIRDIKKQDIINLIQNINIDTTYIYTNEG